MRCRGLSRRALVLLGLFWVGEAFAQSVIHHNVHTRVDVTTGSVHIVDRLRLPGSVRDPVFLLNATLDVSVSSGNATVSPAGEGDSELKPWRLVRSDSDEVVLSITGVPALKRADPNAGHISNAGIYLPPDSGWLPIVPGFRVTFAMTASLPDGWRLISQGDEIENDSGTAWRELRPQPGIWLAAGPLHKFEARGTSPRLIAWLRTPDEQLAQRYLKAARGWIGVYGELIGPYPYGKLALVENFWETGFSMPSFSLMGERVLRLPFILTTAWPHEILHNWFGNSVYVSGGNWSEGLTAYLADHLVREDAGSGAAFRRDSLQKFTNFTRDAGDFPVVEFRSRHDSTTAVVGYDKSLMIFHMLRQRIGDAAFINGLRHLFDRRRYLKSSWDDVANSFQEQTKFGVTEFLTDWISRSGAPRIAFSDPPVVNENCVNGELAQTQSGEAFDIDVPVFVSFKGEAEARSFQVKLSKKTATFSLCADSSPLRIDVDPAFDVLRELALNEIPPSVGELRASRDTLVVLSAQAASDDAWKTLSEQLSADVVLDSQVDDLPQDRNVWVLGKNNRFATALLGIDSTDQPVRLRDDLVDLSKQAIFLARRTTAGITGLLSVPDGGDPAALYGLLRYYDAFSYVAFSSGERRASVRGQWPIAQSPLSVSLDKSAAATLNLPQRLSLIAL